MYFYHAFDIYSDYAWVALLKGKKGIIITNTFQKSQISLIFEIRLI